MPLNYVADRKKVRVAPYCRVSTQNDEQVNSYNHQKRYYENLIKESEGYELVNIYADYGVTGTSIKKREQFKNLLYDCFDEKIDFIITKSISRFARNTRESIFITRKLKEIGVGVYFEKENINTLSEDSEIMLTIISSVAEEESISISKNIKWSIKKSFETGTYVISTPAYGYKLDENKNLIINHDEAEHIKFIYNEYLKGSSMSKISKMLYEMGVYNEKSKYKIWHKSSISRILKNPIYMGDMLCQKQYNLEYPPFNVVKNNGERQMYYIENNHEGIIPRDVFERVSEIIESKAEKIKCRTKGQKTNKKLVEEKIISNLKNNDLKLLKEYLKELEKFETCYKNSKCFEEKIKNTKKMISMLSSQDEVYQKSFTKMTKIDKNSYEAELINGLKISENIQKEESSIFSGKIFCMNCNKIFYKSGIYFICNSCKQIYGKSTLINVQTIKFKFNLVLKCLLDNEKIFKEYHAKKIIINNMSYIKKDLDLRVERDFSEEKVISLIDNYFINKYTLLNKYEKETITIENCLKNLDRQVFFDENIFKTIVKRIEYDKNSGFKFILINDAEIAK